MSAQPRHASIRGVEADDHRSVQVALDGCRAGAAPSPALPRLLFEHFGPTGFVAESGGEVVGFLLGFASQTYPGEAHVHAAWVRPDYRRSQLGTALYECFCAAAHEQHCSIVRSTAPCADAAAIAFHHALGFAEETGDGLARYGSAEARSPDEPRVSFVRLVADPARAHPRPEHETAA